MLSGWLDFEQPLVEIEQRIEDLRLLASRENLEAERELQHLAEKAEHLRRRIFSDLTPWQRVQLARHPQRPYTLDYIRLLFTDFVELRGDRSFAEDKAIVTGLARLRERPVVVIGHQKGRNTRENIKRNFGMPQPEGYRKALRAMKLAEKLGNPVLTFVDTPGAYPGIGAEERGQAEAIARNVREMTRLRVPILVCVTGEGGSGGALAIAVGDRVFMLEYSFYSVISPEGCASILWKTRERAPEAAAALKFTAPDLKVLGVIHEVLPEPEGGAHRDVKAMAERIGDAFEGSLTELDRLPPETLVAQRRERYLGMGAYAGA
jgi:acetyl-CoA carboxylase carboxyl transferase subunit alpha